MDKNSIILAMFRTSRQYVLYFDQTIGVLKARIQKKVRFYPIVDVYMKNNRRYSYSLIYHSDIPNSTSIRNLAI